MTYFCFIESSVLSVPHMEPLIADDLEEAKREAEALLAQHVSGYAAHIIKGDDQVATITRSPTVAARHARHSDLRVST